MSYDHHEHEGSGHVRPSLRASFNNFRTYDAPLHVKIALAFRNNGKPLYFFSHDMAPGDANGEGVTDAFGHWTVAMP